MHFRCRVHGKARPARKNPLSEPWNKFELVLDGPFALVFQQSKPDRLYAFSPVEKSNLHAFFISDTSGDSKKKHTLSLVSGAGALNANNGFPGANDDCMNAFSWHSNWDSSPTDNLVEIDIPVPSRIICDTDTVTPGQFENGTLVGIPQGHILEYDVLDATKTIKISDPLMGDFKPYKSPTPNAIRIRVEIGLWRALGKDPDPVGTHAVSFHNDSLLQRFPNINTDKDKRLSTVGTMLRTLRNYKRDREHFFTTTVECKSGGFLITVP